MKHSKNLTIDLSTIEVNHRNQAIIANYNREINLNTRFVKDKTKYNRKEKHKGSRYDY